MDEVYDKGERKEEVGEGGEGAGLMRKRSLIFGRSEHSDQ